MKKKKLLKRIEELERRNTQLKDKYKRVLFEDDEKVIAVERFIYEQDEKHELLLLKGLTSGVTELETEQKVFKYLHPPTLSDLENMKYHPDPILFNKNYYDWSKAIVDNRGKSAYVICSGEYNVPLASKNENLNLMFPKYCKECKYPILRLDKLATVLKNGQRVFRYEK